MKRLNFVTKASSLRRWIPVAVCCIPALAVAAAIGLGLFARLKTAAAGANPIILLLTLACPVGMGLMMWLMGKDMNSQLSHAETDDQAERESAARLGALYEQRELLETEIAKLEAQAFTSLTDEAPMVPDDYPLTAPEMR